jgi:hypothetical protein
MDQLEQGCLLACPFYKHDSLKHQDCLAYRLRRIKDVKQHLYRKHSAAMQNEGPKAFASSSKLEQWYEMWDILFPSSQRPPSVHVGSYVQEAVPLLRACWENWHSILIEGVVLDPRFGGLDHCVLSAAMTALLDRFEEMLAKMPRNSRIPEVPAPDTIAPSGVRPLSGTPSMETTVSTWDGSTSVTPTNSREMASPTFSSQVNTLGDGPDWLPSSIEKDLQGNESLGREENWAIIDEDNEDNESFTEEDFNFYFNL